MRDPGSRPVSAREQPRILIGHRGRPQVPVGAHEFPRAAMNTTVGRGGNPWIPINTPKMSFFVNVQGGF